MIVEEAIRACEFWTTNVAETVAIFSTRNAEVGETLGGVRFKADRLTDSLGWGGTISRWVRTEEDEVVQNPRYTDVLTEIARRKS